MFISELLSEFTIRRHANAKSCQKGEAYYAAGAVINIIQRDNILQAEVQGNEAKPYHVNLNFDHCCLTTASCTCVYSLEGWCKHIVATMLVCIRQPEAIVQRPSLAQLLDGLNHVQTQRLLQELVAEHPQLIETIDQHVLWISNPTPQIPQTHSHSTISTIDVAPFSQQVRQILVYGVRNGLDENGEDHPVIDQLVNLVLWARGFSQRGEGHNAIALLEAITSTCVAHWDNVIDYGTESRKIVQVLNQAWSEAILSTELTPAKKVDIQVNLETWQDDWDADFAMSLEALYQGWDHPKLLDILAGKITTRGVWTDTIPDYADDLALLRLKILESQERYSEYLYLAQAERQVEQYLAMLGKLGRVEEAIAAAQDQMKSLEAAFTLSKILVEQGALIQALEIALKGLTLPGKSLYELRIWTNNLAAKLADNSAILSALQETFQAKPSLVDYQKIQVLSGEDWINIRSSLWKILDEYDGGKAETVKIEIFLFEGLIDQAIAVVSQLSSSPDDLIHQVMQAAILHNPNWVITDACHRAESIINTGKSEFYEQAIKWLKQARAAYLESGRRADWSSYRAKLIKIHSRKRKLISLLTKWVMS